MLQYSDTTEGKIRKLFDLKTVANQKRLEKEKLRHELSKKSEEGLQGCLGVDMEDQDENHRVNVFSSQFMGYVVEELVSIIVEEKNPHSLRNFRLKVKDDHTDVKTIAIDVIYDRYAIEVKLTEATPAIATKNAERSKLRYLHSLGFKLIRVVLYTNNHREAIYKQEEVKRLYEELGGNYYIGHEAWDWLEEFSDISIRGLLDDISYEGVGRYIEWEQAPNKLF